MFAHLAFRFGLPYLFYNLRGHLKLPNNDLAESNDLDNVIKKTLKKLQKAGYTDPLLASEVLETMTIPTFDDLTSIDRIWHKNFTTKQYDTNQKDDPSQVWKLLKESRTGFLNVVIRNKSEQNLKAVCLHPMDIIYHVFRKTSSETTRILIENLDKMKIALPIVIPEYNQKPQLLIWPLLSINRQTMNTKFNCFTNDHHVVACVRLGDSDALLPKKRSIYSKSDILNQIFFPGQHRFISRNHPCLANQSGMDYMKRIHQGAIETAIFTPNQSSQQNELNNFFQIWNFSGNISHAGLRPQSKLIASMASSIIVIVDNDRNFAVKQQQIIDSFGSRSNIILLILDHSDDSDDSSSSESEETTGRSTSDFAKIIQFRADRKEESFNTIRNFVAKCQQSKPNFSFSKLLNQSRSLETHNCLTDFDVDMNNDIIKKSSIMVDNMASKLEKLIVKYPKDKIPEIIFPIYFSTSPLNNEKNIVEHIEYLKDKKVKLFKTTERGEFEQENEINEKIDFLRSKQHEIAGRSQFIQIFLKDMQRMIWRGNVSNEFERKEWIRIYNKLLAHKLASFSIEGLDVVGFQRELGQFYIATNSNKKPSTLGPNIITCFEKLISAGVSIELVDGDTQNVNKDLILDLLKRIE